LAGFLAALLFVPVLYWNVSHDWASFAFQGPHRWSGKHEFALPLLLGTALAQLTPVGLVGVLAALGIGWKAKGLSVELGAELVTAGVTEGLKNATDRERPSGGDKGFPSDHSSAAFTNAVLANRNLQYLSMSDNLRIALEIGNYALASATAWARVEANGHWLSDVFAGAAIGYFFGAFLHDGFMGLPEENPAQVKVIPMHGGAMLALSFPF
jgi:membrane-associated phospholipid phosphatase